MPTISRRIRHLFKLIAALCFATSSTASLADIYTWKDDKGVAHFSDQPPEKQETPRPVTQRKVPKSVAQQQQALQENLDKVLKPGDPRKTDLFLLTFAGDSKQRVFMSESLYIQNLFSKKYGTAGHGLALINHRSATDKYLIASPQNLGMALKAFSKLMNDEDILYLYLTSHGSKDHKLVVDFRPYTDEWLGAKELRQLLDESKIKWRVIVVSACYSGGFVEALKSPTTLIATASDAENTSFGCSDDREFTYFGEVLFKNLMSSGVGFVEALKRSNAEVTKLENRMKTDHHSNPQLWEGEEIGKKLAGFKATTPEVDRPVVSQADK